MPDAVSNTSPLLYLYRVEALAWLPKLYDKIQVPGGVVDELMEGQRKGYDVPQLDTYDWVEVVEPRAVPSEWLTLDLGTGELETLALGLENPDHVVLLDDALARRIAEAAGLEVWGTLRILLEAKSLGLTESLGSLIDRLRDSGMWISDDVEQRVLALAGETGS